MVPDKLLLFREWKKEFRQAESGLKAVLLDIIRILRRLREGLIGSLKLHAEDLGTSEEAFVLVYQVQCSSKVTSRVRAFELDGE